MFRDVPLRFQSVVPPAEFLRESKLSFCQTSPPRLALASAAEKHAHALRGGAYKALDALGGRRAGLETHLLLSPTSAGGRLLGRVKSRQSAAEAGGGRRRRRRQRSPGFLARWCGTKRGERRDSLGRGERREGCWRGRATHSNPAEATVEGWGQGKRRRRQERRAAGTWAAAPRLARTRRAPTQIPRTRPRFRGERRSRTTRRCVCAPAVCCRGVPLSVPWLLQKGGGLSSHREHYKYERNERESGGERRERATPRCNRTAFIFPTATNHLETVLGGVHRGMPFEACLPVLTLERRPSTFMTSKTSLISRTQEELKFDRREGQSESEGGLILGGVKHNN